ncbi:metallophosphoesterase [Actinoplanes regularis]|uniref:metallophosphoesterase n=1 Tax=Actinoplanes regularis TaxID=52697 RepID=UPI003D7F8EE6
MQSLAVVGDVHGSYDQLKVLIESERLAGRHLIFVGDLIDRGPRTSEVLALVANLTETWQYGTSVIRGNHEQALLDFIDGKSPGSFLRNGGMATIASYYEQVPANVLQHFRETFPKDHLALLRSSILYFETPDLLISHMGYDPSNPGDRSIHSMTLEPHYEIFHESHTSPIPLVVCGHYAQKDGQPWMSQSLICIDTGCGTVQDAPLTALLLPERMIVQSNTEG